MSQEFNETANTLDATHLNSKSNIQSNYTHGASAFNMTKL